jgi:hypothetical protein
MPTPSAQASASLCCMVLHDLPLPLLAIKIAIGNSPRARRD